MKKKQRVEAAQMVATNLMPTEDSVDSALAQLATLTISMVNARSHAQLKGPVGHQAFEHISEAISAQFAVRKSVIAAHASLKTTMEEVGLRSYALGDVDDCPPISTPRAEAAHLQVVAAA